MERLVNAMRTTRYIAVIFLIVIAGLLSLPTCKESRGFLRTSTSYHSQFSLQNETIFQNYTYDNAYTWSQSCVPWVFIDVVDPNDVAAVWFTYRQSNESTTQKGDMAPSIFGTNGWDGSFRVNVSERETIFVVRFYANDTLGNMASSSEYTLLVTYDPYEPCPTTSTTTTTTTTTTFPDGSLDPRYLVFLAVLGLSVVIIAGVILQWRKPPAS